MRVILIDEDTGNTLELSDELLDNGNFVDISAGGTPPLTFSIDELAAAATAFVTKRNLMRQNEGHHGLL